MMTEAERNTISLPKHLLGRKHNELELNQPSLTNTLTGKTTDTAAVISHRHTPQTLICFGTSQAINNLYVDTKALTGVVVLLQAKQEVGEHKCGRTHSYNTAHFVVARKTC